MIARPSLIVLVSGRPAARHELPPGTHLVGRGGECSIVVHGAGISRRHAEVTVADEKTTIRDLESKNGLRINGVGRRSAVLHDDDVVELGEVRLLYRTGYVALPVAKPAKGAGEEVPTKEEEFILPDGRTERHLRVLQCLTAATSEPWEIPELARYVLRLLVAGCRAQQAQWHDGKLAVGNNGTKAIAPRPKPGEFLLTQWRAAGEAVIVDGNDLVRLQGGFADLRVLAAPVRVETRASEAWPVLVLLRPRPWSEFVSEDRVLLTSAAHLLGLKLAVGDRSGSVG